MREPDAAHTLKNLYTLTEQNFSFYPTPGVYPRSRGILEPSPGAYCR